MNWIHILIHLLLFVQFFNVVMSNWTNGEDETTTLAYEEADSEIFVDNFEIETEETPTSRTDGFERFDSG